MTDEWLRQRHAGFATSATDINTIVKRVSGYDALSLQQIVAGYANEVYRVITQQDTTLIVRISQRGHIGYHEEAWAMSRCHIAGVPIPKVYGIETLPGEPPRDIMVLQHALGRSLNEIEESLTQMERQQVWSNVGVIMSGIHSTTVGGFYLMQPDGSWSYPDWKSFVNSAITARMSDRPELISAGLSGDEVDQLLAIVSAMSTLPRPQAVLCHGDLSTEHIFVDENLQVSAVIDFGYFQGGPAALDFAMLQMYHPDVELSWLKDGYRNKALFDSTFETQVLIHLVNIGTSFLAHNMQAGNTGIADIAVPGLRATLELWTSQKR